MTKHLLSMNWFSPKFIDYRAAILSPIASNNLLNWIWFVIHLWFQQYLIHENCGYLSFLMNFFFQWQIIIFFNYELCFPQPPFFNGKLLFSLVYQYYELWFFPLCFLITFKVLEGMLELNVFDWILQIL